VRIAGVWFILRMKNGVLLLIYLTGRLSVTCRRFKVGVIVLGAFFTLQPGFAAENWPASANQYVAQVRKAIDTTDLDCYLAVIKNPNGALLLDVREANEFKDGHVRGTVSISSERLEFRIWKPLGYPDKVDMNRKIYVQCSTGGRATLGAKKLKDIGLTGVTAVVMELADWQKKGHPFVKGASK
jgi:rhodanese-related sulfurtransferase